MITVPILNNEYSVKVCWGSLDNARKTLTDLGYGEYEFLALNEKRGVTFYNPDLPPLIAVCGTPRTAEQIGTLAHEACHAVEFIFQHIGQTIGDEVFAHSVGAIVRETLKAVRGK